MGSIARRAARIGFWVGAACVTVFSLIPAVELPAFGWSDKVQHLVAYAVLAVLGGIGWAASAVARRRMALGLVALGVVIEIAQGFVPGRLPELLDGIANVAGVAAGVSVTAAARRFFHAAAQRQRTRA